LLEGCTVRGLGAFVVQQAGGRLAVAARGARVLTPSDAVALLERFPEMSDREVDGLLQEFQTHL
jgi:hypothetical protein